MWISNDLDWTKFRRKGNWYSTVFILLNYPNLILFHKQALSLTHAHTHTQIHDHTRTHITIHTQTNTHTRIHTHSFTHKYTHFSCSKNLVTLYIPIFSVNSKEVLVNKTGKGSIIAILSSHCHKKCHRIVVCNIITFLNDEFYLHNKSPAWILLFLYWIWLIWVGQAVQQ